MLGKELKINCCHLVWFPLGNNNQLFLQSMLREQKKEKVIYVKYWLYIETIVCKRKSNDVSRSHEFLRDVSLTKLIKELFFSLLVHPTIYISNFLLNIYTFLSSFPFFFNLLPFFRNSRERINFFFHCVFFIAN